MEKIRLGILGMGNMGSGHMEHIFNGRCPEIELTAVADINPARLDFTKERLAVKRGEFPDRQIPDVVCFDHSEEWQ